MLRTFNCGIGFCLIVSNKNVKKKKKYLLKNIHPMRLVIFLKVVIKLICLIL